MHLFVRLRKKVGNVAFPGWLLSAGMAVYCEMLLHLWITEAPKPLRFGAVLAFSLGFGGLTGLLNSLFDGKKWGKWVTFSLNFLLCVFYLAEFFCVDAYKNFMSPAKENRYTGLFKGKNLILITAEAFSTQAIDPELTPFNRDSNTLIIWSGCLEDMNLQVDTPVYSLDILPTLSNLFGVPYDSRLLVGRDVFSEEMPLVLWPNYSWKTDRGTYDASEGVFTPADGQEADQEYIDYVCALVRSKFSYCAQVQNTHYFKWLAQYLEEENVTTK